RAVRIGLTARGAVHARHLLPRVLAHRAGDRCGGHARHRRAVRVLRWRQRYLRGGAPVHAPRTPGTPGPAAERAATRRVAGSPARGRIRPTRAPLGTPPTPAPHPGRTSDTTPTTLRQLSDGRDSLTL